MAQVSSRLTNRTDVPFTNVTGRSGFQTAQASFTPSTNTESWSLHVSISNAAHRLLQPGQFLQLNVSRDSPPASLNNEQEMITPPLRIFRLNPKDVVLPYVACRFPLAGQKNPGGLWNVELMAMESPADGIATPFNLPVAIDQISVQLAERQLLPFPPTTLDVLDLYSLNLKFVLVTSIAKRAEAISNARAAIANFRTRVYNDVFDQILTTPPGDFSVPFLIENSKDAFTWDMTDPRFANLCRKYGSTTPNAAKGNVVIFLFENIGSAPNGPNPLGMSPLIGPQGFASPLSAVFVRLSGKDAAKTGYTIAHELGHYFGLDHKSACAGCSIIGNDVGKCELYLKGNIAGAARLDLSQLEPNLMYPLGWSGGELSAIQRKIVRNAPVVVHRKVDGVTRIMRLEVTVQTGTARQSDSDGAGTDADIFMGITSRSQTTQSGTYTRWMPMDSAADDFEQGSSRTYVLNPGTGMFEEDLVSFTVRAMLPADNHTPPNLDQWLLQGLQVKINGWSWFNNNAIAQWIDPGSSDKGSFTANLTRPRPKLAEDTGPIATSPTYPEISPPFADYPVALRFTSEPASVVRTLRNEAQCLSANCVTMQAWIKPENSAGSQNIFVAAADRVRLFLAIHDGHYVASSYVESDSPLSSRLAVPMPAGDVNRWTHICATCDGTTWTIHRNGEALGSCPATAFAPLGVPGATYIGGSMGPSSETGCFNGEIREVAFWSTYRSGDDAASDLFRIDPSTPGLIGYWPMNEGDGPICYDQSPSQCHAQAFGPQWVLPVDPMPSALYFPSSRSMDFVTIPGQAKLAQGFAEKQITVAGWVRPSLAIVNAPYDRSILANRSFIFGIFNGLYQVGTTGDQVERAMREIPPEDAGNWVKLIGVCDGESWKIYRNGSLLESAPATVGFVPPADTAEWVMGGAPGSGGNALPVSLRQIAVFGKAIDPLANPGAFAFLDPGAAPPGEVGKDGLLAYWPLNDGGGNEVMDQSGIEPLAIGSFETEKLTWIVG